MADVIIVGDGPGGLSAALFLAKNGQDVTVFGLDKTAMHYALLYNYLGLPKILGSDFQEIARDQAKSFGAKLCDEQVTSIDVSGDGFTVATEDGQQFRAQYVVLAEGKALQLAKSLGLAHSDEGVEVDRDFRTAIDRLYVVGRSTRVKRSQAIISAGNGAAAALDILSREKGRDFNDFDSPPKE